MSGNLYEEKEEGIYKVFRFNQDLPITSYMLSLIAGHYQYHSLGTRTGVFAEHSIMDQVKHQLSDLESYLYKAEQYVLSEYDWKNYTIVIVPNSFPPLGMENPQMTFMT